jgi:MFS family permease
VTPERADRNWSRRLLVAAIVVVGVVLAGLAASATIPRWWAQRVGDQVDGSIVTGTFVGLFYGFVFTLLPLLVLAAVVRWRRTRWGIAIGLAIAILLALPNLMTLGIVVGTGNAAHAGDRILDVEAPAFRGGTLLGALLAVGLAGFVAYLIASRARARDDAHVAPTRDP